MIVAPGGDSAMSDTTMERESLTSSATRVMYVLANETALSGLSDLS
jgi:hypothetical protein